MLDCVLGSERTKRAKKQKNDRRLRIKKKKKAPTTTPPPPTSETKYSRVTYRKAAENDATAQSCGVAPVLDPMLDTKNIQLAHTLGENGFTQRKSTLYRTHLMKKQAGQGKGHLLRTSFRVCLCVCFDTSKLLYHYGGTYKNNNHIAM